MLRYIGRAAPRRIDFDVNIQDARVKQMARQGFSRDAILAETDFTPGQVAYRMAKAGTRAYRRGETTEARETIRYIERLLKDAQDYKQVFERAHGAHGRRTRGKRTNPPVGTRRGHTVS